MSFEKNKIENNLKIAQAYIYIKPKPRICQA
ncbi:MAG TPA: hypothetical protein DHV15_08625 [Treponema sp.]|uniref:Uncharacterized protein n=1 Tax=Treponema denticola (strain ATCC 35405 / DSM 14222 / CIP 103919 / JCM 8153 / KCTC 15104) TaxID=243275 RepID=Q73QR6_TREDE|nr:hypothetical protein TDE_0377 [Treponema denticola ATCC 35405]HCY95557.1 hypothetical protein [Treponema sp.]